MGVRVRKKSGSSDWWIFINHRGKRKSLKIGPSKKDAEITAETIRHRLTEDKLGILQPKKRKISFYSYTKTWLDDYIKQFRSAGTYTRYKGILEHKLKRRIGNDDIESITRGNVRDILLAEHKKGASKSSLGLILCVISGAMRHAIDDELIINNPATGISTQFSINQQKKKEILPLSREESEKVLQVIKENHSEFYPFFITAFRTGCRLGELCALKWSDIDLAGKKITVQRTAKDQHVRDSTKTYQRRSVDMSDQLHSVLSSHKKQADEKHPWVFNRAGKLFAQQTIRRNWERALETAEIERRRLHDIRHSFASNLLASNAPIVYVSNQLGHSNPHITLTVYAHFIPAENKNYINELDP